MKYDISANLVEILKPRFDTICQSLPDDKSVVFKLFPSDEQGKPFSTLRLQGSDGKCIAKVKAIIEKLMEGSVLMNGEEPLWDLWFTRPDGSRYLELLARTHKAHLSVDTRRLQIVLYASFEPTKTEIESLLISKIATRFERTFAIQIPEHPASGRLSKIVEKLGDKVELRLNDRTRTIILEGSSDDAQLVRDILDGNITSSSPEVEAKRTSGVCPVCEDHPLIADALETSCGHIYCKECFKHAANSSTAQLPLRCYGEDDCSHIFTIVELKCLLPISILDKL